MPRIYKRIEVFNEKQKGFLKDLGINPGELGLSQSRHIIMLLNLLKPFFKNRSLSKEAKKTIIDFVEKIYFCSSSYTRHAWKSIEYQIRCQTENWGNFNRTFKINMDLLLKLRELYMLKLEKYGPDLAWEKMGWR